MATKPPTSFLFFWTIHGILMGLLEDSHLQLGQHIGGQNWRLEDLGALSEAIKAMDINSLPAHGKSHKLYMVLQLVD